MLCSAKSGVGDRVCNLSLSAAPFACKLGSWDRQECVGVMHVPGSVRAHTFTPADACRQLRAEEAPRLVDEGLTAAGRYNCALGAAEKQHGDRLSSLAGRAFRGDPRCREPGGLRRGKFARIVIIEEHRIRV